MTVDIVLDGLCVAVSYKMCCVSPTTVDNLALELVQSFNYLGINFIAEVTVQCVYFNKIT